jgi:hypothetical protein
MNSPHCSFKNKLNAAYATDVAEGLLIPKSRAAYGSRSESTAAIGSIVLLPLCNLLSVQ